jgi:signal peptidase I
VVSIGLYDRALARQRLMRPTRGSVSRRQRLRGAPSALVAVAVVAIGWFVFAPVAIGGPTSYVVTDGISMLPHFKANGLVLTRAEGSYHVGEVAAYHNLDLHAVVMHRIVAIDGDRYVFKGDNNSFQDSYHPTKSQIVGKESEYIPNVGSVLSFLRKPFTFGLIIGLLGVIAASAYMPSQSRRRRRRHGGTY